MHDKLKNCAFGLLELEYLGHIVSKDGLKANPEKCKAIQEWPQPNNLGDFQSLFSMSNYYSKFVPYFAKIAALLYKLLHKNVK